MQLEVLSEDSKIPEIRLLVALMAIISAFRRSSKISGVLVLMQNIMEPIYCHFECRYARIKWVGRIVVGLMGWYAVVQHIVPKDDLLTG